MAAMNSSTRRLGSGSFNDIYEREMDKLAQLAGNKIKTANIDDLRRSNVDATATNVSKAISKKSMSSADPAASSPQQPFYNKSSEAHIHRIRGATAALAANHKFVPIAENFSARNQLPAVVNPPKRSHQLPSIAEEDEDDVESLDWTSPLDITSFLYKPEYVIQKEQVNFEGNKQDSVTASNCGSKTCLQINEDKTEKKVVLATNNSEAEAEAYDFNDDDDEFSAKTKFVQRYVRSSSASSPSIRERKHSNISLCGRQDMEIPDYSGYIKVINDEIREISLETKRLDAYSPRTKKKMETKEETNARGYVTLKRIYELNPELTESAAKRHICGPAGTQWMGLSRVDVIAIMKKIRREFGASPRNYISRFSICKRKSRQNSKDSPVVYHRQSNKKIGCKRSPRQKGPSIPKEKSSKHLTPRLKASQLPVQHIPGPKHLHTNICIRPWEPDLDGWSQEESEAAAAAAVISSDEESEYEDEEISVVEAVAENEVDSQVEYSGSQNSEDVAEDPTTLEIFNPTATYRLSR